MKVKKCNFGYFLRTYGLVIILCMLCIIGTVMGISSKQYILMFVCLILLVSLPIFGFLFMEFYTARKLVKCTPEAREILAGQGFRIEEEFVSRFSVFFINYTQGKVAALYTLNPKDPQFMDPSLMQNIHTNDHMVLGGTSCVSCDFTMKGRTYRINTLEIQGERKNAQTAGSPMLLNAVKKANRICEMLKLAQKNQKEGSVYPQ